MSKRFPVVSPSPRRCADPFHVGGQPQGFTLADFWAWSTSDLLVNTNRGILAEFLVTRALGDPQDVRDPWRPYDVLSLDGIRVEVKSGAYLQAWAQDDYSYLSFLIAPARAWDPETGEWESESRRQADVYVFCVLEHRDQASVDPSDLDQWRFYVLATRVLDENLGAAKSTSLSRIIKLGAEVTDYDGLPALVTRAAKADG